MTTHRPSVSVLVVTYNSTRVIGRCLAALSDDDRIEIVVHDNASVDDTLEVIGAVAPDAVIVAGVANLGFAAGVNSAAEHASGDVLCLLNPDVVITPGTLLDLADAARQPGVGVVAPALTHPTGRLRVREGGRLPTIRAVALHYSGVSSLADRVPALGGMYLLGDLGDGVVSTEWVSGAVLVTSRETFDSVGGLTEQWFMYGEDIEFCHRVHSGGLAVQIRADLSAEHDLGGSTDERPGSNPAWVVNLLDLYASRLSPSRVHTAMWRATMSVGLLSRAAMFAIRAALPGSDREMWAHEARRFLAFSGAVLQHRVPRPRSQDRQRDEPHRRQSEEIAS